MRDRLIELVCENIQTDECIRHCNHPYCGKCEIIADRLLAAGVIVPPCRVWDRVYYLTTIENIREKTDVPTIEIGTVQAVCYDGRSIWVAVQYTNGLYYQHPSRDFGNVLFLTSEEAAKALAERRANDGT